MIPVIRHIRYGHIPPPINCTIDVYRRRDVQVYGLSIPKIHPHDMDAVRCACGNSEGGRPKDNNQIANNRIRKSR